jgi:hypothetical protein
MQNIYSVRKRGGQWLLCSGADVILSFDSYQEAIETTRSALKALERSEEQKNAA